MTFKGHIQNGGVILDQPAPLPNGTPVTVETASAVHNSSPKRPAGLCAGEFVVPDDFDRALPEYVLDDFEGK